MSTKSSVASVMAWNWVLQSLAVFKKVDSSTLAGLVKKVPAISDDLGKDAREMVSLRILESLFINGNEAKIDTHSAQNDKVSFDPSEHCEDVLHRILDEISEPMIELERQKWNVGPFIMHKRASLPKSPLQKLKEAILEDSHPLLASLKEKSKLGSSNISGNTCPEVNVNFNPQYTVAKDDLVSVNPENENNKLQETLLQKPDHVDESTRGNTEDIKRKEHEHDHDHDDSVPQNREGQDKRVPIDNFSDPKDDVVPNVSSNGPSGDARKSMENGCELETATDDEMTDIAAKKEAFLSSQVTLSQDSMATIDTEMCLCMKCNKGGHLLVCSSNACPFRVHESCLGSTTTHDENGEFFCPFCAYSHAISKYLEVKKKASLARKDLQSFLTSGVKISSKEGVGLDTNESKQTEATSEKVKVNGNEHTESRNEDDCAPIEPSCGDKVGEDDDIHIKDGCLNQPKAVRTCKRKYNEKECYVSPVSSHPRRCHEHKLQYTSPSIPLIRRKMLQWTKSEEEMLKEGMRRFSSAENRKGIPWKEILEFGRDVFHKSRTPIDLKDKWRNICKGKKPKL